MEAFSGSERSHPYAPRQPVALSQQPIGSLVAKAPEERVVRYELDLPLVAIDTHHAREAASVELEAGPVEMGVFGNEAEQRLCRPRLAGAALEDPLEHAHVLSEARPDEAAVRILSEPVHAEDPRRTRNGSAHLEPVPEVVAHVITAERQH